MLLAAEGGRQAALMAPTEILAEQHARGIGELLEPLGIEVVLLTAGLGSRGTQAGSCCDRVRRGANRGRHACPHPGKCFVLGARSGRRRRAASFWSAPADGAAGAPRRAARRARHVRDPDSALARDGAVRRSRPHGARRAPTRADASDDGAPLAGPARGRVFPRRRADRRRAPGLRRLSARCGVGEGGPARGDRRVRAPAGRGLHWPACRLDPRSAPHDGEGPGHAHFSRR